MPLTRIDEGAGIEAFRAMDRTREALTGQITAGISPAALALALFDWSVHLVSAPGKCMELAWKAVSEATGFGAHLLASNLGHDAPLRFEPPPDDHRFTATSWQQRPFNLWSQAFLLQQECWHNATHEVPGVMPHHERVVSFAARQILDVFSPSNNLLANPEVLERCLQTGGANLVRGFEHWLEDIGRVAAGRAPVGTESFVVGRDVAATPGMVVYRNHLIELIQYTPTTETVTAEPVLIVPAWIMKYYILDLSPTNSLVRYLVGRGCTVFCISWRNPGPEDRDLTLGDYRRLGIMAALDAINAVVPDRKIHAAGYCLGGTLLSIAAAAMARTGDSRLASVTLFAAQTDFTEPGELALFIDHSEVRFLESITWNTGYLSADQMAGAFQLLHANDLFWSHHVHDYLMGERTPMTDLMAWNADSTRLPHKMHAEYLRRLYLDNELAAGRFMVDGRPAAIQNIRVPIFVVGTERDHVAPWRSVYKIHYLSDTDVTFVLTSGGHNAGIVSEPGHRGRRFRVALKRASDPCVSPEEWTAAAALKDGSWWVEWAAWIAGHSASERVPPPPMGAASRGFAPIADAPGVYVTQG
jgi:polyhydroxyalkanoate synthase